MLGTALFFVLLCVSPAAFANLTVEEYAELRDRAVAGDKAAEARWRYYIIGLMDGVQAVQGPAQAKGAKLHFCMPPDLPVSPKLLDDFIQLSMDKTRAAGTYETHRRRPMAVFVARELGRRYPCSD